MDKIVIDLFLIGIIFYKNPNSFIVNNAKLLILKSSLFPFKLNNSNKFNHKDISKVYYYAIQLKKYQILYNLVVQFHSVTILRLNRGN